MENNDTQTQPKTLYNTFKGIKVFVYKRMPSPNKFHVGFIIDETDHYLILKRDRDNMPIAISKDTIEDVIPERKEGEGR